MAVPPKPDDKTIQERPGPDSQSPARPQIKSDPKVAGVGPRLGAERDPPSFSRQDLFAGNRTDVKPIAAGTAAAAEVSQGAWRERAFLPRGVMAAEEILKGMADALSETRAIQGPKTLILTRIRDAWLQYLRQAVEQAGGDCLDAWLTAALKPGSGKPGVSLLLVELYVAFQKMRGSDSVDAMLAAADEAVAAVRRTLEAPSKRSCSFKVLERELEGKIDVDALVLFLLSSDDELATRAKEIGQTLERIRDEVKKMPGAKPDGMYSNFARLKAEARLIDGELKRRARAGT